MENVTNDPEAGVNVTPEEACARLAEIKAKKWITQEEAWWVGKARDAGLLPPLTPEETAAEDRYGEITYEFGRYQKQPLTGAQRAWIARARKKGLLLPPTKAPDPSEPEPLFGPGPGRAAWRRHRRTLRRAWLAKQSPEVQAEQAAISRQQYLLEAWKQFERAWRSASLAEKTQLLIDSACERNADRTAIIQRLGEIDKEAVKLGYTYVHRNDHLKGATPSPDTHL